MLSKERLWEAIAVVGAAAIGLAIWLVGKLVGAL